MSALPSLDSYDGLTSIVHATAIVVKTHGLLIRGAPGSGKSLLASVLLQQARNQDRLGAVVGDDLIRLTRHKLGNEARIVLSSVRPQQDLMEVRGLGVFIFPFEPAACLSCVVDLIDQSAVARLPQEAALQAGQVFELMGCRVMHLCLPQSDLLRRVMMVWSALEQIRFPDETLIGEAFAPTS